MWLCNRVCLCMQNVFQCGNIHILNVTNCDSSEVNEFEASRKTIHLLKLYQPNDFRSKEIWLKNLIFFSVHVLKSITFRYGRCFQCCKRNTLPVFQQKTKGKSIRNVHWQAKYYLLPATGFQLRKVHQRV